MKPKISEGGASVNVLNMVFNQVDERWPSIWDSLSQIISAANMPIPKAEFSRFSFTVAVVAINLRSVFDLLPRGQAERIFTITLGVFEQNLNNPQHFKALVNTVKKYADAYNDAVIRIESPSMEVSKLLYYNLGLKNVHRTVVDQPYYVPDPLVVEFLNKAVLFFAGSWDAMVEKYEVQAAD